MKKNLFFLVCSLLIATTGFSQYYMVPYPNAGTNPGGLNNDPEYPVGGGIAAGWTTLLSNSANPTWSPATNIPFAFSFNGSAVSSFKVSNSGCVTFDVGTAVAAPAFNAVALPSATVPDKSVMVLGIRGVNTGDNVVTKSFGTAPNRQFWISFSSYSNANANDYLYYSIVLEETSNRIYAVDQRTYGTAVTTIGLQINSTTAIMVPGSPNLGSLTSSLPDASDNSYYAFVPGVQPNYDMTATAITTNSYIVSGNTSIQGKIRNLGAQTITSLTINYKVDGGATVSSNLSSLNIAPFATYTFTHPTSWNAVVGTHTVDVWATNLNGSNNDANPADDHFIKTISVLSQIVQRLPFFEIFTSSTCGPCKPGNTNYHSIVDPKPQGDFVSIKWQQDFPGTGDPYNTTESVNRRNFYSINSIPRMEIDGGWDQNASSFTDALYTSSRNLPAYYILDGNYVINGKSVQAKVKFTPLVQAAGARVYVAVIENKTVKNVKTNGESEFLNVMKKMLPNENGTSISPTVGVMDSLTFNYTFNGNYRLPSTGQAAQIINNSIEHSVEEFSDLRVIAWVQAGNKEVMQAINLQGTNNNTGIGDLSASIKTVEVYPNPAVNTINANIDLKANDEILSTIVDLTGTVVLSVSRKCNAGSNTIQFNVSGIANGNYHLLIFDSKGNSSIHQISVVH